jgi:transcriptional regulator GlxA family with amidase domain
VCQAVAAVELIAKDKAVTRVERLADELGLSMRGLQRLFAEYVGIGPKWVIRRYRLHEVTAHVPARVRAARWIVAGCNWRERRGWSSARTVLRFR